MAELTVLVPIDGSEPSFAALAFAVEFVERYDATLDVVHLTEERTDATEQMLERARMELRDAGLSIEPEVLQDPDVGGVGASTAAADRLLKLVDGRGYDHVVMGRHSGDSRLERLVVGSCSERLVALAPVPVTVVH